MGILDRLADRAFYGALGRLERCAAGGRPARARAMAKTGLRPLDGTERRDFLSKSLAQTVDEAPEAERLAVYDELTDAAANRLPVSARAALPGRWLERLGGRLRPRHHADVVIETVKAGLGSMDRRTRQTTDSRLIDLAAIDTALEQEGLSEVLAPGDHPIVVGPWTMEVGFELLYWIPLLRRYLTEAGVDPARVTVISRGGVKDWYGGLAANYVEMFEHIDAAGFRAIGEAIEAEHHSKKPFTPTEAERDLVDRIAGAEGLTGYRTIYPAALYGLFRTTWLQRFGGEIFQPALSFAPIEGDWARPEGLPFDGPYVAVKFYESEFFTGEGVPAFIETMIRSIAARHPVVLLNTGLSLDDHTDLAQRLSDMPADRVFDARSLLTAQDNLAVQTALVANAKKLFCTFGGFSYLGPLLGIDTFSFFTHTHFVSSHLDLAVRTFNREGYGSLAFIPVGGMDGATAEVIAAVGTGDGA